MSVNSHLVATAGNIIITDSERTTIDGYISSLKTKLEGYFPKADIKEKFAFGSYTRKTLMPRKADSLSDVDYMVVFSNTSYKPATYLSWLKDFAKAKYATSEIYQDHPTVVLELSKIKIELVPAITSTYDDYQIPAPSSSYTDWLTTHPFKFGQAVTDKNTNESGKIRPLIRLMKYWNALNGKVYSSFELENLIVNHYYYSCTTLWDYVNSFISGLSTYGKTTSNSSKITKLKDTCAEAKKLETGTAWVAADPSGAEIEIKKAFPVY